MDPMDLFEQYETHLMVGGFGGALYLWSIDRTGISIVLFVGCLIIAADKVRRIRAK